MSPSRKKDSRILEKIIMEVYLAQLRRDRLSGKRLAALLDRAESTISGHMSTLSRKGLVHLGHGGWELTDEGVAQARGLLPGIPFLGNIAAGPAIETNDSPVGDPIEIYDLDFDNHFALRVKGESMRDHNIVEDDIVIMRRVESWLNVQSSDIVSIQVPAGTDIESIESLEDILIGYEDNDMPALDGITLKKMDPNYLSLMQRDLNRGVPTQLIVKGNKGKILRSRAFSVSGVLVRLLRDYGPKPSR